MLRARSRRSVAASRRSLTSSPPLTPSLPLTEPLERRALLSGVVMGITPGSSAAGIDIGTLVDNDGMIRQYGTAYAMNDSGLANAAPAGGAFNIDIKPGPTLSSPQYAQALAGFEQAASFFESLFSDPITVVIDAEMAPLGGSTLGLATSIFIGDTYDTIRDRMVSDAHSDEAAFLQQLPAESGYFATLPSTASFTVEGMLASRANLLALGVPASELMFGPDSQYDPSVKQDASITFSTNYPWDFNRADGISPGLNDFLGVAIHEIGHALGFTSGVDTVDQRFLSGGPVAPMPLDLFRIEPGAAANGAFGTAYRVLAPGNTVANQVFHDGGLFNASRITQIPGLITGDVPMSTGQFNSPFSHGHQASHWKDESLIGGVGNTIGSMDPVATAGTQQTWTAADTRAMSLIGWDAAAPAGVFGTVYEDPNGNGARDAGEQGLSGWTVYHDVNNNGQHDVTSGGSRTVASTDVPKFIPDAGSATSVLNVSGATGTITDVDVTINVTHSWDEDLIITLVGPDNTQVRLANRNGDDGDNFTNTIFDDEASQSITTGTPPFSGRHRPVGQLANLDGVDPNGTWALVIQDVQSQDIGRLNSWSITFSSSASEPFTLSGADGTWSFTDLTPGSYTFRQVVQPGYRQTAPPNNGPRQVTLADGQSVTGQDFGNQTVAPTGISGIVYEDVDRNGRRNDGDFGLYNWRVYQDVNNNGQWDSGTSTRAAREEDIWQPIWHFAPARSPLTITDLPGNVRDVNVNLEIAHPWTTEVSVYLISPGPNPVRVLLLNREGDQTNHENILQTTLDDEAAQSLDEADPPFRGTFRPRQPLSAFDGVPMNGTWTLEAIDHVNNTRHGGIGYWSLTFQTGETEPNVLTDALGQYQFPDLTPGTYRIRQVVQPGYAQVEPAGGGAHVITLAEGQSADNRNFGNIQGEPNPTVQGRHVFYSRSSFDTNGSAAGDGDDAAIAPDKSALLPGETATFSNYTTYSRGINGIMIDIGGLPQGVESSLTAADFGLRAGNTDDPSGWGSAPNPSSITVRRGAGAGGSDRITLTWPDGAIVGKWLQVNVQPNERTGLVTQDTFYFGNLPGETGNNPANAATSPTDYVAMRTMHVAGGAGMDNAFDFNRDGRVNPMDLVIVRRFMGRSIPLLSAPSAPPAEPTFSDTAVPPPPRESLATRRVWDEAATDVLA